MDQENKNPEDVKYLQKLKSFEKKLSKRVQQQELDNQQFREEREELLAVIMAKILRDEEEMERVWAARRAFMAEVKKRREDSLNEQ